MVKSKLKNRKAKEAFDWLAENRDQMDSNPKNFANHLIIAVGQLVISRDLIKNVMKKLFKDEIITSNEYERNFQRFENLSNEQLPTVVLISNILQKNCAYFQADAV
uniref:Bm1574 n=1 Tax=Brugia malayi TaxID=6279 RepID=A0A7I4K7A3_BRUMA